MTVSDDPDLVLGAYFHAIADRRRPEGVVAEVVARTATVRPRPAWYVTARGNLGRPATRLATQPAYRWLAVMLVLMLGLVMLALGGAGGGGTPFQGRWTSEDHDGSRQSLTVGRGMAPRVDFTDDFASMCAANGDSDTTWEGSATGEVNGGRLHVEFGLAGCSSWFTDGDVFTFDYDSASDTLLDGQSITWHRVR